MSAKTFTLAYCRTNEPLATTLAQHLGRAGYRFQLLHGESERTVAEQLTDDRAPLLLLVTDNFLRSSACIHRLLPVVKQKSADRKLLVITADGTQRDDGGEPRQVPTRFERVSEIIRYMNHWQDTYLDLRKAKREADDPLRASLDLQLATVRDISAEIGELLRQLRDANGTTLREFQRDDYAYFFQFINDEAGHAKLRGLTGAAGESLESGDTDDDSTAPAADLQDLIEGNSAELLLENDGSEATTDPAPVDLATIPGMSLLSDRTAREAPAPAPPADGNDEADTWPEAHVPLAELATNDADDAPPTDTLAALESVIGSDDEDEQDDDDDPKPTAAEQDTVAADDNDEADDYVETAQQQLNAEEIAEALDTFRAGLATHPDSVELRYRYAVALIRHQYDLRGATQQLETLLDYDEDNVQAYFLLAEMAELHKDYLSARNYYQRVAKLDPTVPGVYYRLGLLTQQQFPEKRKKAFKYFREAIQQDPSDHDARYQYALLLWQIKDDPQNAIAQLNMVLDAAPDHPFAHYDLARLYHEAGDMEAAQRHYRKAIVNNPEVETKHNDRAFGLLDADAPDEEDQLAELQEDIERLGDQERYATVEVDEDTGQVLGIADVETAAETAETNDTELSAEEAPVGDDEAELEAEADDWGDLGDRPTVLITGATSGIGRATAVLFAKAGYRLILTGRRADRLAEMEQTFRRRTEADVHTLNFDVSRPFAVQEALNGLPEAWREIDILINNAGLAAGKDPIHEGDLDDWDRMIDTNVKGLLYMTRAISPHMVRRQRGHIINVGSVAGKQVYPNGNVYCATKHAVDALTRAMRIDLHQYNIRVSQVAPGHVAETEFAAVRHHGDAEKAAATYAGFQPLTAPDVAEIIFFIATRPPHVNVQDILVFGTAQASATIVDRTQ